MTNMRSVIAGAVLGMATAGLSVGSAAADDEISVLAGTCASCHGTDGVSPGAVPSIAGAPYRVLQAQLVAFKEGEAQATVMGRIARGYSDEQLDALARYFSEISE